MKRRKIATVISWAAVLVCMAVIFILSAQTGTESQDLSDRVMLIFGIEVSVELVRKCAHCLEYMGLAVLVFNALYRSFGYSRPYLAIAISSAYAASDEIHQLFVEGRSGQLTDVLIDSFGAAIGVAVLSAAIIIFSKIKGRRSG